MKNYNIGSVSTRFYYDILGGNACLSGAASRKTRRDCKRIASKANRLLVKSDTKGAIKDFL